MKSPYLLLISFLLSNVGFSQNFPACDSLVINCCTYNTFGPNTVSLEVSNNSSVLFDYPGFVLFDSNMDTIAIETVNYFGISIGPQSHIMNITAPLTLPFNGYLNLFILFYDTLACSFPITLPDTTTGISLPKNQHESMAIFPNPVVGTEAITIKMDQLFSKNLSLKIVDTLGKVILSENVIQNPDGTIKFDASYFLQGIYYISIQKSNNIYRGMFFKI